MTKKERDAIIEWSKTKTDDELEKAYYDSVYDSLGSLTDKMYDLGYDIVDIKEREKHEDFLCQKNDLIESLCYERGIELWKEFVV